MNGEERPYCFGDMETVFPKGEDGLRTSPPTCMCCFHKTQCLRTATQTSEGLKMREEQVDNAYQSGMIGFLERWSQKKNLHRRMEKQKKEKKRENH